MVQAVQAVDGVTGLTAFALDGKLRLLFAAGLTALASADAHFAEAVVRSCDCVESMVQERHYHFDIGIGSVGGETTVPSVFHCFLSPR